jgi:hypothetical protein
MVKVTRTRNGFFLAVEEVVERKSGGLPFLSLFNGTDCGRQCNKPTTLHQGETRVQHDPATCNLQPARHGVAG